MKPKYDLAILIRTLHERTAKLDNLLKELHRQSNGKSVQIVWLGDNFSMSAGAKLNALRSLSQGVYSGVVDDDDMIEPNYVDSILEAIKTGKKVITFDGKQFTNDVEDLPFVFGNYSVSHRGQYKGRNYRRNIPNHLCFWRYDVACKESFLDINIGEDHRWAEAMQKHYTNLDIYHIDESLYIYNYNSNLTRTRRR